MEIARTILFFLVILSLGYTFAATYSTWSFLRKQKETERALGQPWPPVSIIKPLAEVEESSLESLLSFFNLDYPRYEVIFSLPHREEKTISVFEDFKKRFPDTEIRWTVADQNQGPNYKVGNLIGAVREAKYEILAISDSDMRVGTDYLRRVVPGLLQEKVGLVTCLYRAPHIKNIFDGLQSLTLQTDFIPNVLLDHRLEGISYGFGATLCTRKQTLESLGGLETFREYLADDYQVGNRIREKGYEISLSRCLVDHISSTNNFTDYFLHQLRWAVTQRVCRPIGYSASIITRGVFLTGLLLVLERFSPGAVSLFFFMCGIRILGIGYLNKTVIHNDGIPRYLWLIPLNDLLNTITWFLSFFVNTVHWRDRRFRVLKGGKIAELHGGQFGGEYVSKIDRS